MMESLSQATRRGAGERRGERELSALGWWESASESSLLPISQEQEKLEDEIYDMESTIQGLDQYKIVDKLGEGECFWELSSWARADW